MSRRSRDDHGESNERWLVSYADFITLLFAFFTVMYATSQADMAKQKEFESSIRQSFAAFGGPGQAQRAAGADESSGGGGGLRSDARLAGRPVLLPGLAKTPAQLEDQLAGELLKGRSDEASLVRQIRQDPSGVRIELDANLVFATNSGKLRRSALAELDRVAERVRALELPVEIEAHGSSEDPQVSSWDLTSEQASTMVIYLIGKHQFKEDSLSLRAYGGSRPVNQDQTPEERARNRRMEFLIRLNRP